jgi:hypothetical protein
MFLTETTGASAVKSKVDVETAAAVVTAPLREPEMLAAAIH